MNRYWVARAVAALTAVLLTGLCPTVVSAAITEARVLVIYNSAATDATALKNSYLAAHPGIPGNHVLDLNDPALAVAQVTYADFIARIRNPIRTYLTSLGAAEIQNILAFALIRPFPHRILDVANSTVGDNPFAEQLQFIPPAFGGNAANVTCASVDSELTLLWQNLETGEAGGNMDSHSDNLIANPYFKSSSEINTFSRVNIQTQKSFATHFGLGVTWGTNGSGATLLTAGDLYLVCRVDGATLAAAQASITRAQNLYANKATMIILLDEFDDSIAGAQNDLDNENFYSPPSSDPFYGGDDYEVTQTTMQAAGWTVRFDGTTNFIEPVEETRTLIGFATYGENHGLFGAGQDPPGNGVYPSSGYRYARGAMFNPLESYSGRDLNGLGQHPSIPQGQVGDFIASGGTFAVGNVWEPFANFVPDNLYLMQRMLVQQKTWAEAAWSATPALSWQQIAVGDPLGRFSAILNDPGLPHGDMDGNGAVDGRDIRWFVDVVTNGIANYRAAFPTLDPIARGDFDGDLTIGSGDWPGFIAALLAP